MADLKNVSLEEHVYHDIVKRQLPDENMSQTVERILRTVDKARAFAQATVEIVAEAGCPGAGEDGP